MLTFYTSLVFFQIFADIIMLMIISSDSLIEKQSKDFFRKNFIVLIFAVGLEWLNIYLQRTYEGIDITYPILFKSLHFLILTISPFTLYYIGCAFKKTKLSVVLVGFIIANFFFQIFVLCSDKYYVVAQGFFMEGNLYWIYNLFFILSVFSILKSMLAYSRECQTNNTYVLVVITFAYGLGNILQMVKEEYVFILLSANLASIFLYSYYISMTNKIDMLTNLLNRICFANRLKAIKKDCIIICFDLNKFKEVNDTFGHSCGDEVLKKISQIMFKVYSKYGYCYRIGGDEFCVILLKSLNKINELNSSFINSIIEEQKLMPNLTSASIGYSYYYANKSDIESVIKEADDMLYEEKAKLKNE